MFILRNTFTRSGNDEVESRIHPRQVTSIVGVKEKLDADFSRLIYCTLEKPKLDKDGRERNDTSW